MSWTDECEELVPGTGSSSAALKYFGITTSDTNQLCCVCTVKQHNSTSSTA